MCGIVLYRGTSVTASDMINSALANIHRGDDGVGILYRKDGKILMEKFLYGLEEISNKELSKDRLTKRITCGSIEMTDSDEEAYEKEQDKFEKKMEKLHSINSDFFVLHHRKSTYGANTIKNQHPIYYNNKYYIHNGTANEFSSVKTYLEVYEGHVFESETDTEVIAVLYSKLKKEFGDDSDKIYNSMKNMFPSGFGVLIEVDKKGNTTIVRDTSRKLWRYSIKGDDMLLVSEPILEVMEHEALSLVALGVNTLDSMRIVDYTPELNKVKEWWERAIGGLNDTTRIGKCDMCDVKKRILSTFHCDDYPVETRKDMCYNCMLYNLSLADTGDELDSLTIKQYTYGDYLGKKNKEEKKNV